MQEKQQLEVSEQEKAKYRRRQSAQVDRSTLIPKLGDGVPFPDLFAIQEENEYIGNRRWSSFEQNKRVS